MQTTPIRKSAVLAFYLTILFFTIFEIYLRAHGFIQDYDDNAALWSNSRSQVYDSTEKPTVFIGSSRIKYDLDLPTWETETGGRAIQLAMVGSSPVHLLQDLAEDPCFRGRLVIDVTEALFFGVAPRIHILPDEAIRYYHKITPAQQINLTLDRLIESKLVFLNESHFSLNALIGHIMVPNRIGVPRPRPEFPFGFGINHFDRQSQFSDEFITNDKKKEMVKSFWTASNKLSMEHPVKGEALDSILHAVKSFTDKIKARGGKIIFTRTPSSGSYLFSEQKSFPRENYWEKLIQTTGCRGIYYADYRELAQLVCPENSHLQPRDARVFTKSLAQIIKNDPDLNMNSR